MSRDYERNKCKTAIPALLQQISFAPHSFFRKISANRLHLRHIHRSRRRRISSAFPLCFMLTTRPHQRTQRRRRTTIGISTFLRPSRQRPEKAFMFAAVQHVRIIHKKKHITHTGPQQMFGAISGTGLVMHLNPRHEFGFGGIKHIVSMRSSTGVIRAALLTETTRTKIGRLVFSQTHAMASDGKLESIATISALTMVCSRCARNSGVISALICISSRPTI